MWPGKDKFLVVPKDDAGKPVWVERDHPAASEVRLSDFTGAVGDVPEDPHGANLLFIGDSLDVLRILCEVPEYRSHYRGKIRLVYIDPPFNTGQAFEHYDDWMEHSTWLSFMRERLLQIRDLLAPDGSVWVHLDDAEQHRMRLLLDEVFGPANFVATVIWEKADSPRNSARQFSTDQDYVLVYSRDPDWSPNRLPRTAESDSIYTNPDDDPRGPWLPGDPYANKPYSKGLYTKTGPTGRAFTPPPGRYWRISEEKLDELDADGRIWWGPTGNARPSIKRYLSEVADLVPRTIWSKGDVGSNRTSKNEMRAIFTGVSSFATPKPERFMERVLRIGSNPGDIVLDCFAGSGTTAAVAHKMNRRWVTAELSTSTVEQFTLPRLAKVVHGEDPGGITKSVEWEGGGGFRTVTVGPSMYEDTPFGVLLAEWATNGRFARAVAGQLGFEFQEDAAPLCGVRGRMRLAVIDGAVGPEEIRQIVGALGEKERVTVVAKSVLAEAEATMKEISPGSRIRKAPRDLLTSGAERMRRRTEVGTRYTHESTEGPQS
ncbi:MAG: site-specific DNA-methyltransferase [Humibacillus sp.]|nr:site-specific DNA-methyltransferase [Humibacillus sp.]MDN5778991.1 site-specific DNA-methyltransferase [Humibacillus sp.]